MGLIDKPFLAAAVFCFTAVVIKVVITVWQPEGFVAGLFSRLALPLFTHGIGWLLAGLAEAVGDFMARPERPVRSARPERPEKSARPARTGVVRRMKGWAQSYGSLLDGSTLQDTALSAAAAEQSEGTIASAASAASSNAVGDQHRPAVGGQSALVAVADANANCSAAAPSPAAEAADSFAVAAPAAAIADSSTAANTAVIPASGSSAQLARTHPAAAGDQNSIQDVLTAAVVVQASGSSAQSVSTHLTGAGDQSSVQDVLTAAPPAAAYSRTAIADHDAAQSAADAPPAAAPAAASSSNVPQHAGLHCLVVTEQQDEDSRTKASLALGLVAHHSLGSDPQSLCLLLQLSNEVRRQVVAHCSGPSLSRLELEVSMGLPPALTASATQQPPRMLLFVSKLQWLIKHGAMVSHLRLSQPEYTANYAILPAGCAALLMPAAAAVQPRHLSLSVLQPAAVLRHIGTSCLTVLELTVPSEKALQDLSGVIAKLHGLRELDLKHGWEPSTPTGHASAQICSSLASLTQLSKLVIDCFPKGLQQLSQLQELQMTNPACEAQQLVAAVAAAPVGALSRLQKLTLQYQQPLDLYSNTGIWPVVQQHAGIWRRLAALQCLSVVNQKWDGRLDVALADGIAAATSLTSLSVECPRLSEGINLCTVLAPLRQLHQLTWSPVPCNTADEVQSFEQVFSHNLTQLTSLVWTPSRFLPALPTVQLVSEPVQLKELRLRDRLEAFSAVPVLAFYLTSLEVLELVVTDSQLSALGDVLAGGRLLRLKQLILQYPWPSLRDAAVAWQACADGLVGIRPGLEVIASCH